VANIKQQKKRILVGQRQRLENLRYRSSIKTYFRRLQTAVDGGDADAVAAEHVALVKLIDKAGAKRVLHPNTAARKKSNAASIVARGPQETKVKRKRAAPRK
jgi:small subunit ribosomal protein S20